MAAKFPANREEAKSSERGNYPGFSHYHDCRYTVRFAIIIDAFYVENFSYPDRGVARTKMWGGHTWRARSASL